VVVFTIDSQIAAGASVCFSSGQLVTFFLCFPPYLQHGPRILMLCMTSVAFLSHWKKQDLAFCDDLPSFIPK
jgi:hypothetical protein